jgi:hypothetical protein
MRSFCVGFFSATMLATTTASAQTPVPHRIVRVSPPSATSPAEVSVAINRSRPENIVAVSLQTRGAGTDFAYVSFDAGTSWASVQGPNPHGRTQGDDAVVFDDAGHAFWSYISFAGLRVERPDAAANGIFVNRSDDGGRTWRAPVPVIDHLNTVEPFEDKPFLRAGSDGKVYLAWTRFSKYATSDPDETSHILFSMSEDGGESFSMPMRVSDSPGDAIDSDGTLEGVVPALGVDGEIFLVWSGPRGLVFDKSTDDGRSFGDDRVVGPHPGGWDIDIAGLGRANGMPVTGVDHSQGPHRGALYVNWVDDRHGDPDVFVMRSNDAGERWSEPVRVNADPPGNGSVQFFPWMAVDPIDGSVNVAYYDRSGLTGTKTGVTFARSIDGGASFESTPVDVDTFETNPDVFFGDYLGIDAYDGRVVAVFQHFTSESDLALSAALFRF